LESGCGKSEWISGVCKGFSWDNGYNEVVGGPIRGDALLDIYLLRPESSLISFNNLPGISGHKGILLEAYETKFVGSQKRKEQYPCTTKQMFQACKHFFGITVGWKWQLRRGNMEKI
jgi:hypothetical protein